LMTNAMANKATAAVAGICIPFQDAGGRIVKVKMPTVATVATVATGQWRPPSPRTRRDPDAAAHLLPKWCWSVMLGGSLRGLFVRLATRTDRTLGLDVVMHGVTGSESSCRCVR
jgi:hypothetical protein